MILPKLTIRDRTYEAPIIQGGMGVGVSRDMLAGTVAHEGCIGILSSACLDFLISHDLKKRYNAYDAMILEVQNARILSQGHGGIGVNIMVYLARDFDASVRGAVDAKADMIICGAGLPLQLPQVVGTTADIALIPIVSSVRALRLICARWAKKGRRPDAVVVEGPLAGGHLGFAYEDLTRSEHQLDAIFPPIKEFAMTNGDFPVIVAGGIYTHQDICDWITRGADGVQMGTRFLVTEESGASLLYKQAVIECTPEEIIVCHNRTCPPGSPSGMPFRTLTNAPMYAFGKFRRPFCNRGYVLQKDAEGSFSICAAKENSQQNFCICNGLLSSAGYAKDEQPLFTVGTNAHRVDRIVSTHELICELKGS